MLTHAKIRKECEKVIPIYICDDDKNVLQALIALINKSILIQNYDMEIVCATTDPLEMIQEQKNNDQRSIYFLDVDLGHDKYDGFSLAKQIREIDTRGFIIFVTTHEELMFETFKYRLEAMSYLIKEATSLGKQITHCLDDIHHLVLTERIEVNSYYTARVADKAYQLPVKEILYFETSPLSHHVIAHMNNRRLEFRGNLNAIEKEIGSAFLRIHRSFLVHNQYITSTNSTNNTITLNNGVTCMVSRRGKYLLKEKGLL